VVVIKRENNRKEEDKNEKRVNVEINFALAFVQANEYEGLPRKGKEAAGVGAKLHGRLT